MVDVQTAVNDALVVLGSVEAVVALFGSKSGVCVKIVDVIKGIIGIKPAIEAVAASPTIETVVSQAPAVISQVEAVVAEVEKASK